ncbi:MAG: LytR/AlgR family response regulator transcription factor [Bacteroidia bacterium]
MDFGMDTDTLNILLVEDDMIIGTHISMVLSEAGYQVSGILPSGEAALTHLAIDLPDLILMDINLKGKLDGVETAIQIKERFQVPLIFLTANTDQVTFGRAKEAYPLAFIAKPFEPMALIRAIELAALNQISPESAPINSPAPESVPLLLSDRIFVRSKHKLVKLLLSDIHYVSAERNYCKIFTADKEYTLSIPMKHFSEQLDTQSFQRVHRSFIINLVQVEELDESHVYLNRKPIPVSKSYREALLQRLKLF